MLSQAYFGFSVTIIFNKRLNLPTPTMLSSKISKMNKINWFVYCFNLYNSNILTDYNRRMSLKVSTIFWLKHSNQCHTLISLVGWNEYYESVNKIVVGVLGLALPFIYFELCTCKHTLNLISEQYLENLIWQWKYGKRNQKSHVVEWPRDNFEAHLSKILYLHKDELFVFTICAMPITIRNVSIIKFRAFYLSV